MRKNTVSCNAAWNIGSLVCNLLLVFVCTPIIIRELGETVYGVYVILGSVGGILSIASLGMGEATLKYVAEYVATDNHLEVRKVFTSTFLLYSTIGLGISLFLFVLPYPFIRILKIDQVENAKFLFRITAIIFWVHLMNGSVSSVPAAVQRYEFASFVNFTQNILQFIFVVSVIRLGYGLRGIMCVTLLNALLILSINFAIGKFLIPHLGFSWPGRAGFRKVFKYGIAVFGTQLIGLLWQYSDHILLSSMIGPQAVSIFSVPMQTVSKGVGLISAGMAVLFPHFSSLSSDYEGNKEKITETYIKATQLGLLASIALCVPLAVMLPDFLRLWISSEFAEKAASVATILALSYIIRGAFLPYEPLLKGLGLPKYIFCITLCSSLVIAGVDLLFIPFLGTDGVGYSYVISSSIGVITIVLIFRKLLKIPMVVFWRDLFAPYFWSLLSVAILIILRHKVIKDSFGWVAFLALSALVFLINVVFVACGSKLSGTKFRLAK